MEVSTVSTPLPRVTIKFCTQCKWMLRAAYFAQELLSTFNTALGEVALQPSTGGTFIVEIFYSSRETSAQDTGDFVIKNHVIWDRKAEGGFPETKELKRRVRDIIEPGRDLGHVDRKKKTVVSTTNEDDTAEESKGTDTNGETDDPPQASYKPLAISRLRGVAKESERKFTPMDVDSMEIRDDDGVKRNPDGSICEECL